MHLNVIAGMYRGLDGVRKNFEEIFEFHPVHESEFSLEFIAVEKNMGFAVWSAETPEVTIDHATDSFVFDDDAKIVTQTFVANPRKTDIVIQCSCGLLGEILQVRAVQAVAHL